MIILGSVTRIESREVLDLKPTGISRHMQEVRHTVHEQSCRERSVQCQPAPGLALQHPGLKPAEV